MKPSKIQAVPIDDDVEALRDFIRKSGEEPEAPDIEDNAYSPNKLGDLGEQYVKCLFKATGITKIQQSSTPTPDFKTYINRKPFHLEVKTVGKLFSSFLLLLNEISQEETNNIFSDNLRDMLEHYDFSVNPIEIHREDKAKFKEVLRVTLKDLNLQIKKTSFDIECPIKKYTIRINRKVTKIDGIFSLFTGFLPDETKSLSNIVLKKFRQLGCAYIWIIILLNRTIEPVDLLNFFYRPIELPLPLKLSLDEISENSSFPSIIQYEYDRTPWGFKFKNKQGHTHTIGERLKCAIVVYPHPKTSFIFPAIKHFENFSTPEYWH